MAPELREIRLDLIDDHPDNPRLGFRQDVVDAITANLDGKYPAKHAVHVRPIAERFQLIAGHHRTRAARNKKLKTIWAWVEELDDDAAFMELALSNNQGELSPLEIGMHALKAVPVAQGKRGKGLKSYAARLGKTEQYVGQVRQAAEVLAATSKVDFTSFLDKAQHLSAIHKLPEALWQAACEWLASKGGTVKAVEERVKAAADFLADNKILPYWQTTYLVPESCAAVIFCGGKPATFNILSELAQDVMKSLEKHKDLLEEWVAWLEANAGGDSWSMGKVQEKRGQLDTIRLEREQEPPSELVTVLLADPPWQYDFSKTTNRDVENQYPTATVEEIKQHLASQGPELAEDCVLFLWATAPKLREALEIMAAWGFTYKTNAVWDKEKIGMGYWFRGQHELLLVGTRGNAAPPESELRVSSVFREARNSKHSKKPACVYEAIESMFPGGVRCEMYQRSAREGWKGVGSESASQ